jgi:hypothetical protein
MIYSEREIATGSDVALIANRVQFMSMADKKAILEVAGDRGYITQNEGREILNLPPLEGGDVAFIRGEYAPTLTKINELQGNGDTEPEEGTNDGN